MGAHTIFPYTHFLSWGYLYKYQADCSGNIKSGWGTCAPVAPSLRPPLCTISWIVSHRPFNHPSTSIQPSPSLSLYFLCLLVFFIISFVFLFFSGLLWFIQDTTHPPSTTGHRPSRPSATGINQVDHWPPISHPAFVSYGIRGQRLWNLVYSIIASFFCICFHFKNL